MMVHGFVYVNMHTPGQTSNMIMEVGSMWMKDAVVKYSWKNSTYYKSNNLTFMIARDASKRKCQLKTTGKGHMARCLSKTCATVK